MLLLLLLMLMLLLLLLPLLLPLAGKPLSKCGKCKRYMKYISARPQRMYCQVLPPGH